ncbi:DUF1684 domain-containing protein [Planctomonas sp. JC2975]|uniref:DUF1684 domain-containing protein n=1 Tax=Planctomonas sp. JC2975 TaxID=2729626 RepID=UPI00147497EF|nr:DUF1684 domain-containing protein [Planctomonas sp. JC2975]NNC12938.1 DUF1684 domain-containing protein [Planctomonas sp. JC2975]
MTDIQTAVDVADWRRRVFALYELVRELSEEEPAAAHAAWVVERDALFATHPSTPLLAEDRDLFSGLPVPEYDPSWRFELPIEDALPADLDVETGTDGVVPFERIGVVRMPDLGSLDVWRLRTYGGGLFVPVKDASAGRPGGTYGGGRYLLDTIKGADLGQGSRSGTVVLDFNFAYNPSCAYDPAWACPLAPPGNTVGIEIPVGERYRG